MQNALVPGKCNIIVLSPSFDKASAEFKEEYWYKTKYRVKGESHAEWALLAQLGACSVVAHFTN